MKATSLTRRQRMFMEVAVFLFMCKRKFEIFALFIENKKSMFFYRLYSAYCDDSLYFSRSMLICTFYTLFIFHNMTIFLDKRQKYRL